MKKSLLKKISLLLCGTFFLSNIISSNLVYASSNQSICPNAPKKGAPVSRLSSTTYGEQLKMQRHFLNMFNGVSCPNAPKKGAPVSRLGLITPEEQREMRKNFFNTFSEIYCPDDSIGTVSMNRSGVTAIFEDLNMEFSSMFKKMCYKFGIDERIYIDIFDLSGILSLTRLREDLFLNPIFAEFGNYVEGFLARVLLSDGRRHNLEKLAFQSSEWLDDFVERHNLND